MTHSVRGVLRALRERSVWLELALVALPFAWSSSWVGFRLRPVELHDSFAYLWRAPISEAYFVSRALGVRLLYSLCGNHPGAIALVQLAIAFGAALCIQLLLRDPARSGQNLLIAGVIAVLATSFNYGLLSIALGSDPLFVVWLTLFPFVLVLARGRRRPVFVIAAGLPLVLSHNMAPAIVLAELAAYAVVRARRIAPRDWSVRARADLAVCAALAVIALAATAITHAKDTSVHVNAGNNLFTRVLPDRALVRHFQEQHALPAGDYVSQVSGRNVLATLDGQPILRVSERTRNYELVPDRYGLAAWIEQRGSREYWKHRSMHEPVATVLELRRALRELYGATTVTFWSTHVHSHAVSREVAAHNDSALRRRSQADPPAFDERAYLAANPDVAGAVRRGELGSGREHYDRYGRAEGRLGAAFEGLPPAGLLAHDPIALLSDGFGKIGFSRLEVLIALLVAIAVMSRFLPDRRVLAVGVVLLSGSLVGFALGYLADAMDVVRHVWPGALTLTVALTSITAVVLGALWTSMLEVRQCAVRRHQVRDRPHTEKD